MDRKELTKKVVVGAVILGAFVGAVIGAASYWTGGTFQPAETDRALKNNQVLFNDQKNSLTQEGGDSGDSFWEDRDAGDEVSGNQQPGYLFTPDELAPEATTAGIVGPNAGNADNGTNRPSTGIEITNRPGGTAGTVTGGTTGGGTTGGTTGGNTGPTTPSSTVTGDGTVSNPYQGDTVATDPSEEKKPPSIGDQVHITDRVNIPAGNKTVIVMAPYFSAVATLYKGQVVDGATIFASLDTYMTASNGKIYYWSNSDYGKLFRIDAISFDEKSWFDMSGSATVTIPAGAETMYIRVSYRYKTSEEWVSYDENPVTYPLSDSRILLLKGTVKNENSVSRDQLLNIDGSDQVVTNISYFNTLRYQNLLIQSRENIPGTQLNSDPVLKTLFPGWQEKGQTVSFHYPVTLGRHVLQAPKSVKYDTNSYRIVLRYYWMLEDYSLSTDLIAPSTSLSYVQALTAYTGKVTSLADGSRYLKTLRPPVYTQAVDFSRDSALTVDTLSLPNTVFYVNTDGIGENGMGLRVRLAYEADEGNPHYTAKDGLLYNKDGTEILGVPTGLEKLTVPENVTNVHLPYGCQLKELVIPTKNKDAFPDVNFDCLPSGSTLFVDSSVLETVLQNKAGALSSSNLYVAPIEDPDTLYRIHGNLILNQEDRLHGILDTEVRWLSVPEEVTGMEEKSLNGLNALTMVHLPVSGKELSLEKGCFDGAPKLETVVCYSEAQYTAAKAVAPEGVQVLLAGEIEADGYRYLDMGDGQIQLLNVPKNITEFTGIIPDGKGGTVTVTSIGNDVFSECADLRWVDLVPEVTAIGQNAFRGCTGLEGVVIGATDNLMIGKDAFSGCTALRFLASNALHCDLRSPDLRLPCTVEASYAFLYCPIDGQGYNSNWCYFVETDDVTSNVSSFVLKDCGGTKVLYGLAGDDAWMAIRSGGTVDGKVRLPASTRVIHKFCFQNASAPAGSFNLNWEDLDSMFAINSNAFLNSALGPDVVLPPDLYVYMAAFKGCTALQSITIPDEDGAIKLSEEIFYGCSNLTTVTIGEVSRTQSSVPSGLFNSCSNLRELNFTGAPPRLSIYKEGDHFRFNLLEWADDATEEEHLHIIVPEGMEEEFIHEWRCGFLGCPGYGEQTGYQALWEKVAGDLGGTPSDEEIRQEVDRRLLVGENHIRALLGMEKADAPSHRFTYTVEDSMITLTGANNAEYVELTAATLDMPAGWTLDYIGSKAFRNSPNLRQVTLPEGLVGIYNEPFAGVECPPKDKLQVVISGTPIPRLMGFEKGVPFNFGVEDDAIRIMFLSDGDPEDILKAWILPMTGFDRLEDLILSKLQEDSTADSLTQAVLDTLFTAENRLRTMLELKPIQAPQEMVGIPQEEVTAAVSAMLADSVAQLEMLEEAEPAIEATEPETAETEPVETPTEAPETTEPTQAEPAEPPKEEEATEPAKEEEPAKSEPTETPEDTAEPEQPPEPLEEAPENPEKIPDLPFGGSGIF